MEKPLPVNILGEFIINKNEKKEAAGVIIAVCCG